MVCYDTYLIRLITQELNKAQLITLYSTFWSCVRQRIKCIYIYYRYIYPYQGKIKWYKCTYTWCSPLRVHYLGKKWPQKTKSSKKSRYCRSLKLGNFPHAKCPTTDRLFNPSFSSRDSRDGSSESFDFLTETADKPASWWTECLM